MFVEQIIFVCNSDRIIKIGQYLRKLCSNEKGSSFVTRSVYRIRAWDRSVYRIRAWDRPILLLYVQMLSILPSAFLLILSVSE